jgi:phosphosulfolactate phosphohydrolase-like enzyme
MSEDVTIRAARAQQLIEDEVLEEGLSGVVADALYAVANADLSNQAECVAAVAAFQAAEAFSGKLKQYITSGRATGRKPFKVA